MGKAAVVWKVVRDRQLLRIESAFFGFSFAEHATWLAVLVFAYQRGGVSEAGVVAFVQMAPAMIVTPFAAYAGDRFRPERVLAAGYLCQSMAMAATAAAMWADQPVLAYATGAVSATCVTFSRPVIRTILPIVARTPNDLVAANVVTGFTEYVGMFVGPLVGAGLLAAGSPAAVYATCAAVTATSALLTSRITLAVVDVELGEVVAPGRVVSEIFGGLRALARHASLRTLVLMVGIGALAGGANDVLMVSFAERRLDSADGGAAGVLGSGLGVGAVIGAVMAAGLIGRARLLPYLLLAAALTAAPYFGLTVVGELAPAIALFFVFGLAESLLRVTTDVGIQRDAPDHLRARIFGVCEALQMGVMAFGSMAVSLLVYFAGLDVTLAVIGGVLAIGLISGGLEFRRIGGDVPPPPQHIVERILLDPVFEHLSGTGAALLAAHLDEVTVAPGDVIVSEGEIGDRYYLIVDGSVTVTVGGEFVRTMGAGRSFGEIALLRNVPRTATVVADSPTTLYAVTRDEFLATLSNHPRSWTTADRIATDFLPDATT